MDYYFKDIMKKAFILVLVSVAAVPAFCIGCSMNDRVTECAEDSVLVRKLDGTITPLWALDNGEDYELLEEDYCVLLTR